MEISGRVQNGVVVLDEPVSLPEGLVVRVVYSPPSEETGESPGRRRIQLPLVHCDQPGSVHLTNERIAEILDGEESA